MDLHLQILSWALKGWVLYIKDDSSHNVVEALCLRAALVNGNGGLPEGVGAGKRVLRPGVKAVTASKVQSDVAPTRG